MNPINFRIYNFKPTPNQGGKDKPWRDAITKSVSTFSFSSDEQESFTNLRFSVSITFFFIQDSINESDLDNLIKPVIDILFFNKMSSKKEITGKLFTSADDSQVHTLYAEKKIVATSEEQGIDVSISQII